MEGGQKDVSSLEGTKLKKKLYKKTNLTIGHNIPDAIVTRPFQNLMT